MLASSLYAKVRGGASATGSEDSVDPEDDLDDSESASGTVSNMSVSMLAWMAQFCEVSLRAVTRME